MKIRQFVSLAVFSTDLSAELLSARIGMDPDHALVRGSKRAGPPPLPRAHLWAVTERTPARIDDQAEKLLLRIGHLRAELAEVGRDPSVSITLQVVRYFDDADGAEEAFGWHLPVELVEFLSAIGAALDVDEYDYSGDDD